MKNNKKYLALLTVSTVIFVFWAVKDSLPPMNSAETVLISKVQTPTKTNMQPPNLAAPLPKQALASLSETDRVVSQTPKNFTGKPFAPSLEGTEIDGRLKADAEGNLILDLEVRDLFDYFLNAAADVSPETVIEQLEKLANDNLPKKTVKQVMDLLDDYIKYKETAMALMDQDLIPANEQTQDYQIKMLENSFHQLKDIRRQTMSPEAVTAFFGLEEAYGSYTLESIKIQNNDTLSMQEKAMQLSLQRQQLPEILQRTESRMIADTQKSQTVDKLLLSNQKDDVVASLLAEQGLSSEAIDSAMNYRKSQKVFETQYQLYQRERKLLLNSGLSSTDQQQELENLRHKYFTDERDLTQAKVKDLSS